MPPDLTEEKKLWKKGFKRVVCLDEVGRGSLAGPVVAAAVSTDSRFKVSDFGFSGKIKDSKKLSGKKRQEFYEILTRHPAVKWGTGRVYGRVIDRINILQATKLAMARAIENLEKKLRKQKYRNFCTRRKRSLADFLILDGKMKLNFPVAQKSIVKADEKVFSCAIASIIAKVKRDRLMCRYAKKYPQYFFEKHKAYGTLQHRKLLKKYGPCKIHRESFGTIKSCQVNKILID